MNFCIDRGKRNNESVGSKDGKIKDPWCCSSFFISTKIGKYKKHKRNERIKDKEKVSKKNVCRIP